MLQDGSNDVKTIAAASLKHVARVSPGPLDSTLLKVIVPALIATTKEKNTTVKSAAESALLYVLRLRDGESTLQVTVHDNARKLKTNIFVSVAGTIINMSCY